MEDKDQDHTPLHTMKQLGRHDDVMVAYVRHVEQWAREA
jgi:hypothetical protein